MSGKRVLGVVAILLYACMWKPRGIITRFCRLTIIWFLIWNHWPNIFKNPGARSYNVDFWGVVWFVCFGFFCWGFFSCWEQKADSCCLIWRNEGTLTCMCFVCDGEDPTGDSASKVSGVLEWVRGARLSLQRAAMQLQKGPVLLNRLFEEERNNREMVCAPVMPFLLGWYWINT